MNSFLTSAVAIAAKIGDLMLRVILNPLESFSPVWGIIALGCITGVIILLVFRYTSNAPKIAEAKNRLKGDLLEIWLFNHDVGLVLRSQLRLFLSSIRYISHTIIPLLILSIPGGAIISLMESWYDSRPLAAGEEIVVALKPGRESKSPFEKIRLELPGHIESAAPPVRLPALGEISWKLKAGKTGNAPLVCVIDGEKTEIPLEVSGKIRPVYSSLHRISLPHVLLYFGSAFLPAHSKLESVRLGYPERDTQVLGRDIDWLIIYFVTAMLCVLLLMKKFRVTL